MYKAGDKFEIEIAEVLEQGNTCLYRIKGFHSLVFDDYGLDKLKKIDAPKVEKELHIGDEVVAATGRRQRRRVILICYSMVLKSCAKE